jgi:fengycin family lipopeptide synthetase D
LNLNGKVDKEKLAALSIPDIDVDIEEQPSELESEVARIWREILHVEQIGLHDSFFDVGGHSLNALTLVNRVHKEFNVNLSLKEVFSKSTVKLMAGYIDMQQWLNKGSDANGITRSEIII